MLKRYPHTLRWRQALPPIFVIILAGLIVLSLGVTFARYLLALQLFSYFFVLEIASLKLVMKTKKGFLLWGLPIAIATMHIFWGAGFLWSGILSMFKHG